MKQVENPGDEFALQRLDDGTRIVLRKEGVTGFFGNLQRAIVEQQATIVQPSITERSANVGVTRPQLLQFLFDVCPRHTQWKRGKRGKRHTRHRDVMRPKA
jgi:hypothetical protein